MALFRVGDPVKIDSQGHAVVTKVVQRGFGRHIFYVKISGIDYEAEMSSDRLKLIAQTVTETKTTTTSTNINNNNNKEKTRFSHVNENEISEFIEQNTNKNTQSKTLYDMKTLQSFFDEVNEKRIIHELPVSELSSLLCRFFISVRKPDGSNYEPGSLRGMMGSFDRQLRRYNYGHVIITSPEFSQVREVLVSKQKMLKREGMGNMSNKSDAINDEEVEVLWSSGQFGGKSPDSILQTLWFYNTVHFGLRGCAEHRDMCWGDITLHKDNTGQEYLSFNERQTKTRTGSNPCDIRVVKPKLWANLGNPQRCAVLIYKLYAEKRPSGYSSMTNPFYLACSTKVLPSADEQWFKRQPVGKNKLGSMMTRMIKCSGIKTEKRLSNHSARKYLVQKLNDNSIPANQIMQISGHKNISSINNYSNINENQHKQISRILHSSSSNGNDKSQQIELQATVSSSSVRRFHSIIGGNIYGGNVNIHIHQSANNTESETIHPPRKKCRIESDSD